MVNTINAGHLNPFVRLRPELPWHPPLSEEGQKHTRTIPFQVWKLDELQAIAQKHLEGEDQLVIPVTVDCIEDMQREKLTDNDVAELIKQLEPDDYVNSLWCMKSRTEGRPTRPEFQWLPCDAYTLPIEQTNEDGSVESKTYYLKLCKTTSGAMLLMVSVHPSEFD